MVRSEFSSVQFSSVQREFHVDLCFADPLSLSLSLSLGRWCKFPGNFEGPGFVSWPFFWREMVDAAPPKNEREGRGSSVTFEHRPAEGGQRAAGGSGSGSEGGSD